ncbi:MAG: triple tyrosine motif-containing protein, partial [Acidobacteriota bacterium]
RLIGFDETWIEPTQQRSATFTNLPPADYRFEVSARHESGAWSDPTTLQFTIAPRFYQTRTFLAAAGGSVVLAAIAFYRLRTRALRRRQERLEREVADAVDRLKVLRGLLPICASCKKIRDDGGYWSQIEQYVSSHSEAEFSHGLCPDCVGQYLHDTELGTTAIQQIVQAGPKADEPLN